MHSPLNFKLPGLLLFVAALGYGEVLRQSYVAEGVDEEEMYMTIPEPTTATLSLLALAMLAARRRRKN